MIIDRRERDWKNRSGSRDVLVNVVALGPSLCSSKPRAKILLSNTHISETLPDRYAPYGEHHLEMNILDRR